MRGSRLHACILAISTLALACDRPDDEARRRTPTPTAPPSVQQIVSAPRLAVRGDRTCTVLPSGTVRCWEHEAADGGTDQSIEGSVEVAQVTVGDELVCLLRRDGKVECQGSRARAYELGALDDVGQLAGGDRHTCAVRHDGSVWCWGDGAALGRGEGSRARPAAIAGLPAVRKTSASNEHTCALARQGSVHCWGRAAGGALGDGSNRDRATPARAQGLSGAIDLAVSDDDSCAITANNELWCWGHGPLSAGADGTSSPTARKVADIPESIGLAIGPRRGCLLLRGGTVSCGTPKDGFVAVEGLGSALEVVVGSEHACALRRGGQVLCWGAGTAGEPSQAVPVPL